MAVRLTVSQLIQTLMPLTMLTEAEFCNKHNLKRGTFKHWRYDETRYDDLPRKLVQAFERATSIPAWRIYFAFYKGDDSLLLRNDGLPPNHLKRFTLFRGIETVQEPYSVIALGRKAQRYLWYGNVDQALIVMEQALEALEYSQAQLLSLYLQIHRIKLFALCNDLEQAEKIYLGVMLELNRAFEEATNVGEQADIKVLNRLRVLSTVEWFLASPKPLDHVGLLEAKNHLHLAHIQRLQVQIPLLHLFASRCFVELGLPDQADESIREAELSVFALSHPALYHPEWFLEVGESLPDNEMDFSWLEHEVSRHRQKLTEQSP